MSKTCLLDVRLLQFDTRVFPLLTCTYKLIQWFNFPCRIEVLGILYPSVVPAGPTEFALDIIIDIGTAPNCVGRYLEGNRDGGVLAR